MSKEHFGLEDSGVGDDDRIRLSPAAFPLLVPEASASVFSAVMNLLVELRENSVPPLAQPVPERPGWFSTPLARDIGIADRGDGPP
ncbi:hypothetical protein [Streptomyces triculaminicus]|uniref:hypothetical protein n=1 Tax=Streptomyces triculaminicus TaxID=2816232 RepID=UPI00379F4BA8